MFLVARSVRHPTRSIFFLITAVAAYFNARFLALLIMFRVLVIADQGAVIWRRVTAGQRHSLVSRTASAATMAGLAALLCLVSLPAALEELRYYRGRVWVDADTHPVGAARFLKTNRLGPNLALPFHWGEYAIWHLYPDYQVSQDGRYETVYRPAYIDSLLAAYYAGDLERFTERQDVDVLLVESGAALDWGAQESRDWYEIYRDPTATVYVPHERLADLASRLANAGTPAAGPSAPIAFP